MTKLDVARLRRAITEIKEFVAIVENGQDAGRLTYARAHLYRALGEMIDAESIVDLTVEIVG